MDKQIENKEKNKKWVGETATDEPFEKLKMRRERLNMKKQKWQHLNKEGNKVNRF